MNSLREDRLSGRTEGRSPDISLLLEIDREYRQKAASNLLKKIAPKSQNPEGMAWLPVMNTSVNGWRFTVLFSNTAKAHELGKTADWVVVYYESGKGEQQCTVVTEHQGHLAGKRVVRGRERECLQYYGMEPDSPV